MSIPYSCAKGHKWTAPNNTHPDSDTTCPICGLISQPITLNERVPADIAQGDPEDQTREAPVSSDSSGSGFPSPPPQIDGFRIREEIGRGGMGIVYRATQESHNREVAIKVIRQDRLTQTESVRRFRREAQLAERLTHPNLVSTLGFDYEGDLHYLVMEYVHGHTLQQLVEDSGPLTVQQACEYMAQSAQGLAHAWEKGLVHRDVKPSNLMVSEVSAPTTDGNHYVRHMVKVLDLGVARLYQMSESPVESLTTLTQPNTVLGTADFIAPEQLEDPHNADHRADMYSLGCTFYYLLSGQVPFRGGTLIQKLDRQRWETPPSVDQLRKDVPKEVAAVIRRLMMKHPDDRYQSFDALLSHLQLFLKTGEIVGQNRVFRINPTKTFQAHNGSVWCACLTPDGKKLITGGQDRMTCVWDTQTYQQIVQYKNPGAVFDVAVSPCGNYFVSAAGATLRVRELANGKEVQRLQGHNDSVRSVNFHHDGFLVSCADDKTVRVWDVRLGREILRYARHREKGVCSDLSPLSDQVISAGKEKYLRLWNMRNGQDDKLLATPTGQTLSVCFSADGQLALSTHFDTSVRVWDLRTGREWRSMQGHKQMVTVGIFSRDGRWVLSGSKDKTIRLWDLHSGAELAEFTGHDGGVTALCLSGASDVLYSTGQDGNVCVWPVQVTG